MYLPIDSDPIRYNYESILPIVWYIYESMVTIYRYTSKSILTVDRQSAITITLGNRLAICLIFMNRYIANLSIYFWIDTGSQLIYLLIDVCSLEICNLQIDIAVFHSIFPPYDMFVFYSNRNFLFQYWMLLLIDIVFDTLKLDISLYRCGYRWAEPSIIYFTVYLSWSQKHALFVTRTLTSFLICQLLNDGRMTRDGFSFSNVSCQK